MPEAPNPEKRPSLTHPGILLATWFGSGYLPKAPGTWGSLAALPFAWGLVHWGGMLALGLGAFVVFVAGVWASKIYMDKTGAHDPGAIVIDEVAGQWIVLLAAPLDFVAYGLGFVLFRVFDVLKPWPISWADKKIGGATGVMLDDILAGLAGLAVLYLISVYGGPYLPNWGGVRDQMYPEILIIMVEDLFEACAEQNLKLALAESCTGGLIAGCVTSVAGSSAVLDRGFVTYSNDAKAEMLGVPEDLIETYGAVSEEVAIAMAEGALMNSDAQITLSVTGIAGPGGGTDDKPVGLVHMAVAREDHETQHQRHVYKGDRDRVRIQTVESGLKLVLMNV